MEPCGIYQITNLINGKKYIGQSRRIFSRWKQHTQSLSNIENIDRLPPLRRAFVKYGLKMQVSSEGIFSGFKFEIIEECSDELIDEAEYNWINKVTPEYNIMMQEPSADKLWPKRDRLQNACYIQYHNANAMGHYPFENGVVESISESHIISKKRDCLRCKGERVYLVVGLKTEKLKRKRFFLWGYTQIEDVEAIDDEDGKIYGLKGVDYYCEKPILLNDIYGFDSFLKNTMGSFAYGLQNASKDPFSVNILNAKYVDYSGCDSSKKYLQYISDFELNMGITDEFHLIEHDESGVPDIALFYLDNDDDTVVHARYRTLHLIANYPEIAIHQILTGNYKTVHTYLFAEVVKLIDQLDLIEFILYYEDDSVFDFEFVKYLRNKNNTKFEKMA